jgi:hypothetical protein
MLNVLLIKERMANANHKGVIYGALGEMIALKSTVKYADRM